MGKVRRSRFSGVLTAAAGVAVGVGVGVGAPGEAGAVCRVLMDADDSATQAATAPEQEALIVRRADQLLGYRCEPMLDAGRMRGDVSATPDPELPAPQHLGALGRIIDLTLGGAIEGGNALRPDCEVGERRREVRSAVETLVVRPAFAVTAERFALVMPTPSRPAVGIAGDMIFDDLNFFTGPDVITTVIEVQDPSMGRQCGDPKFRSIDNQEFRSSPRGGNVGGGGCGGDGHGTLSGGGGADRGGRYDDGWGPEEYDDGAMDYLDAGQDGEGAEGEEWADGADGLAPPAVRVEGRREIGAYELAVVSADDPATLAAWLDDRGFRRSGGDDEVLGEYVRDGWKFVIVTVRPGKVQFGVQLPPLAISFASESLVLPYRISRSASGRAGTLNLHLVADGRYEVPLPAKVLFSGPVDFPVRAGVDGLIRDGDWITRHTVRTDPRNADHDVYMMRAELDEPHVQTVRVTERHRVPVTDCEPPRRSAAPPPVALLIVGLGALSAWRRRRDRRSARG